MILLCPVCNVSLRREQELKAFVCGGCEAEASYVTVGVILVKWLNRLETDLDGQRAIEKEIRKVALER